MGFSKIELTKMMKESLKDSLCNMPQATIFKACNLAQDDQFFIRGVYKNGTWTFTDSAGDPVVEGTDFVACT